MFCNTVWNGLYILPYGDIRLCSIGNNQDPTLEMNAARDRDGNIMNILTHDIKEIMNSDKHREVRRVNMADPTAWSPHCSCCENREIVTNFNREHKNKSRRIYLMQVDTNGVASENDFQNKATEDGSVDWYPRSLDIRFGNLCNQKCVMCSPEFSHLWYDDQNAWNEKKGVKKIEFHNGQPMTLLKNKHDKWIQPTEMQWYDDPRWWPKFEEMMPHLRHIYITGGEPMITPGHDTMLDKLIESGNAKNILLEYDTNCSVVNDKIAGRWVHFKKVDLRGSMDAIGAEYELIRSGGKWDRFVTNVKKLKEYEKDSNKKITLSALTSCVQTSTAYSIVESEEWCKSIGIGYHIRFLEGPPRHSATNLPREAKLELIEYYRSKDTDKSKLVVAFLKKQLELGDTKHMKSYIEFMDFLDVRRKTNWRETLPKISDLLERTMK
jgi:pyruvate-formate lyase-activating enzyme